MRCETAGCGVACVRTISSPFMSIAWLCLSNSRTILKCSKEAHGSEQVNGGWPNACAYGSGTYCCILGKSIAPFICDMAEHAPCKQARERFKIIKDRKR